MLENVVLSYLKECRAILAHQRVTLRFVLVVQSVQIEFGFMLQEGGAHLQRTVFASFEFQQKMLRMKFAYFLHITKDDIALTAHRLRNILSIQFGRIVLDNIMQGPHVIAFGANHFTHDKQKRSKQMRIENIYK